MQTVDKAFETRYVGNCQHTFLNAEEPNVDAELRLRFKTTPTDFDRFVHRITEEIDSSAVVSTLDGVSYATLSGAVDAANNNPVSIALMLATAVEKLGGVVDDIDDDLVDLSEVAKRVGRSRETVRLWSLGRRGAGEFPLPSGLLPGSVKVWEWDAINAWLSKHHPTLADDVQLLSRVERAKFRVTRQSAERSSRAA
jgi:predicted DNA-binding transcriptional regulator AlpA